MFKLKTPAHVALGAFVLVMGLGAIGCDTPAKDFVSSLKSANGAMIAERNAYAALTQITENRGNSLNVDTIKNWDSAIATVSSAMAEAKNALQSVQNDKDAAKVLAARNEPGNALILTELKRGVDEILARNYEAAALKAVAPWKLGSVQPLADDATHQLQDIANAYDFVFNATSAPQLKGLPVAVTQDLGILDTLDSCKDSVRDLSAKVGVNSFCNDAAAKSCDHQIDLDCLSKNFPVNAAASKYMCADQQTDTVEYPDGSQFQPTLQTGQVLKNVKRLSTTIDRPNPDRLISTFCPSGDYQANPVDPVEAGQGYYPAVEGKCYGSTAKVRIYGFDKDRHVTVQIEGVNSEFNSSDRIQVNVWVDKSFVKTVMIDPDYGQTRAPYILPITERAFQKDTQLALEFKNIRKATVTAPSKEQADGGVSEGDSKIVPASWVIQGQIKGMDVPSITMRQYNVTYYKPSAWVSQTINACNNGKLILK